MTTNETKQITLDTNESKYECWTHRDENTSHMLGTITKVKPGFWMAKNWVNQKRTAFETRAECRAWLKGALSEAGYEFPAQQ